MSDELTYFNQSLWQHSDKQISTSIISIDSFVSKDSWHVSPPKLKVTINQFKAKIINQITLNHQEVFQFIQSFKQYENSIGSIKKEIESDRNKQVNIFYKNKKSLIATFLYKIEYGGPCIRIVISERDTDYLDSEKAYMSIMDFLSFIMIFGQFKSNYFQTIQLLSNAMVLKQIENLEDKLTGYYSELSQKTWSASSNSKEDDLDYSMKTKPLAVDNSIDLSALSAPTEKIVEENHTSSESNKIVEETVQNDLSEFIKEKRDTFDLGIKLDSEPQSIIETKPVNVLTNSFTEKVLLNDITNLEMYLTNFINSDLPFSKFVEIIKGKLDFDPLEGIRIEDINSVNYLTTNYLKTYVKNNIEKKEELPSSVTPIIFESMNSDENRISLAYDLLVFSVYYTQVRNILKDKDYNIITNKDLICFTLKTLSAPIVFSLIRFIDKNIVSSEIVNRYRKYKSLGIFEKLETNIFETRTIKLALNDEIIKTETERMYSAVIASWKKLIVKESFSKFSNIKLTYDDIQNNKLTDEQIKKILSVEFNFRKNNKVNFSETGITSFDDIPTSISEKFGILQKKYDNTNLKRFVNEKCKDNKDVLDSCLKVVENINESYRDLKTRKNDLSLVPEEILKAIVLWDLEKDMKISLNYVYYLEVIKQSMLTKDMILSMLTNIQTIQDKDFTSSFMAARDE